MTQHQILVREDPMSRYYSGPDDLGKTYKMLDPEFPDSRYHDSDQAFRINGGGRDGYTTWSLTWCDADSVDREVTGGPLIQAPHGFCNPRASVISNPPQRRRTIREISVGDTLVLTDRDSGELVAVVEVTLPVKYVSDPKLRTLWCRPATADRTAELAAANEAQAARR